MNFPIQPSSGGLEQRRATPVAHDLESALRHLGTFPPEALVLGIDSQGLPAIVNLQDPKHGRPIIITSDSDTANTHFLRSVIQAAALTHNKSVLSIAVITGKTDQWSQVGNIAHCIGIERPDASSASAFVTTLANVAMKHPRDHFILLPIDDMDSAMSQLDSETKKALLFLMRIGPRLGIWPILTAKPSSIQKLNASVPNRTIIFGQIENQHVRGQIGASRADLPSLRPGEYTTPDNENQWYRFQFPS